MTRRFLFLAVLMILALPADPARRGPVLPAVRLILTLSVDQMRPDYLARFKPGFQGGLARLLREGAVFPRARQDHALTLTAPGHSTLLTGMVPGHTGIISNNWYDRSARREIYCVEDPRYRLLGTDRPGGSPARLQVTTLGDWMKREDPHRKVISVSGKDRSAILMGGQRPDGAYWFDSSTGNFVSSTYYQESYPHWLQEFNSRKWPAAYFGRTWERLLSDHQSRSMAGRDDFPHEGNGRETTFPHRFESKSGTPDSEYHLFFMGTPWMDAATLKLGEAAISGEALGRDPKPDLLALGLSATDSIGHSYGPDSQEILDQLVRLDRFLGNFFAFLDRTVGLDHVLMVLTADHGAMPLPEILQLRGIQAARILYDRDLEGLEARLAEKFGIANLVEHISANQIYLNRRAIKQSKLSASRVEAEAAAYLKGIPWVQSVFTRTELEGRPSKDPLATSFLHSLHPENSGDVFFLQKRYHLFSGGTVGTSHGSAYDYDANVPLIFWHPALRAATYSEAARTVDIAPTLAQLAGVAAPGRLDGRPLNLQLREKPKTEKAETRAEKGRVRRLPGLSGLPGQKWGTHATVFGESVPPGPTAFRRGGEPFDLR
ncbi:MAG: alkaline phosphatase family protein [Acidobacteria bacterium]|nr:alkaline phosphatase family protein [Acidobacteriota bacterium]